MRFVGLQAYDGAAAHTTPFDARKARTSGSMKQAVETRRMIEREGIDCPLVTGGSTGTYLIDAGDRRRHRDPAGQLHLHGRRIRPASAGRTTPSIATSSQALTVVATVISRRPGLAIVDAGYKAFATDRPFPPTPVAFPAPSFAGPATSTAGSTSPTSDRDLSVGDRVEFVPPHCDPTVNLYDLIHALRGNAIEAVWPIAARGKSQ